MRKTSFSLKSNAFGLVLFLFLIAQTACAQQQTTKPFSLDESPLPAPTGFVNDYAGVLDADTKQKIETQIKTFKERSNPSVEIGVAIVKTTGERDIFDYSIAVARGWKIGSKADDNPGALLFVAVDDRKYFTQISRNLEDELPDGVAGQLNRQYLVPAFKQGNYGKGISDTIDAYIKTIEAKQTGQPVATPEIDSRDATNNISSGGGLPFGGCMTCLIILFIILILIFSRRGGGGGGSGRRNRWGGGGFGGSALPWIIGGALGGMGNGGSSSGWSGGSSGGDSWGGFGGGGDFGGGGAGGSW